jgi:hypothetical protein
VGYFACLARVIIKQWESNSPWSQRISASTT